MFRNLSNEFFQFHLFPKKIFKELNLLVLKLPDLKILSKNLYKELKKEIHSFFVSNARAMGFEPTISSVTGRRFKPG